MARDDNDTLREQGRNALDPTADLEPVIPPAAPSAPTPHGPAKPPPSIAEALRPGFDALRRRANREEKPIPLPWNTLAAHLGGGLWPGLHVLVGNTGSGKSQLAIQAAHYGARHGVPAAYVGLELDTAGIVARLAALELAERRVAVHWSTLYLGENPEALERAEGVREDLARLPFHPVTVPPMGWSYQDLRTVAEGMRAKYPAGPFLLVLDFLQLVSGEESDLRERIGRAAYVGRAVARDLGAAVLLVSSTARENYAALAGEEKDGTSNKKAQALGEGSPGRLTGLGKESGEIEYAADTLLVLGKSPNAPAGERWCGVAKVRARSSLVDRLETQAAKDGWARLHFNGTRFEERTQECAGGADRLTPRDRTYARDSFI